MVFVFMQNIFTIYYLPLISLCMRHYKIDLIQYDGILVPVRTSVDLHRRNE